MPQSVEEVSKEFRRWKKTDDYARWRKKQFLRQGGLCWYCGDFLPDTKINVEHKTARSLGGRNNRHNPVLSCSNCNKKKGSSVLSKSDRTELKKINKARKGTYLKNKEWRNRTYGDYTETAIVEKLKQLS